MLQQIARPFSCHESLPITQGNSVFDAEQTEVTPKHRVKWWDCEDLAHPTRKRALQTSHSPINSSTRRVIDLLQKLPFRSESEFRSETPLF